jgi:hexosaminidase
MAFTGQRDTRIDGATERFLERVKKVSGFRLSQIGPEQSQQATLVIHCDGPGLSVQSVTEDESYSLTMTQRQARLAAPNPLGILRGLETFWQLMRFEGKKQVVPCVTIRDHPRFRWRGLLIDVGRHWQPREVIRRNLDGMAAAKLNVLHWHLTEDQGFPIESKKFPRLHQLGSNGGYYTQEDVKQLVAYARERGIRVVPEFDMPGHVTSWLVGYPELASAPGPYQIAQTFEIKDPSFDPTREEVYQFIDAFLAEMTSLFPDEYLHIGGDEVTGKQWESNPQIRTFMSSHQLNNKHDLQAYFNLRLSKIVLGHGKKMIGWDEILHPDLPKTVVVQSWRGPLALAEAAKSGYDGILSHGYYLDLIQTAAYHYGVDPIPANGSLTPEQQLHVLGGEAAMWGEYVTPETIDSRIWPRAVAIAERLWSPATVNDVKDIYRRLTVESSRLEGLGLKHNANYEPMLQDLVGSQPVDSLKVLADVVEPVKFYARGETVAYTTQTPMNRLVDAARPESDTARQFRDAVDEFLRDAPRLEKPEDIQAKLRLWRDNDKILTPILEKSPRGTEIVSLSQELSNVAGMGLEAVKFVESKSQPTSSWVESAQHLLDAAQIPQQEVEIAIIPAIRKLLLAAAEFDRLRSMAAAEWNVLLDAKVESARPKPKE